MTFARYKPSAGGSHLAVTGSAVGVAVLTIGAALYLTPAVHPTKTPTAKVKTVVRQVWPSPTNKKYVAGQHTVPKTVKHTVVDVVHPPAKHRTVVTKMPYTQTVVKWVASELSGRPSGSSSSSSAVAGKYKHCWDYKWQQDAQAAYVANLSDPGGLDGLAGPFNGNGIACEQLPVDPSRPQSTAIDAIPVAATTTPSKADVMAASSTYFGVSNDALPGDAKSFDQFDRGVGKAPSLVEFFDTWDHSYASTGNKVKQTWARGALPVLTWMPEPKGGTNSDLSDYTLDSINQGRWNKYLFQWAAQVVQTGEPMGIRFAHEMNGSWYPWAAGLQSIMSAGQTLNIYNSPTKYIDAWRHVWDVFNVVGANKYVIWDWTPAKSLCTVHAHDKSTPGRCSSQYTTYSEDFPGDQYVDWVGLSAYAYGPASKYTFANTFGESFHQLSLITDKPVYVAETGAAERITTPSSNLAARSFTGTVSMTADKVAWTTQTLQGFLDQGDTGSADNFLRAGQRVVGFVLFNNYVPAVHRVNKQLTETDWRWNSSTASAAAFRKGVDVDGFSSGTMPIGPVAAAPNPDLTRWPVIPEAATTPPTTTPPTTTAPTTTAPTTSPTAAEPGTTAPTTSAPTSSPTTAAPATTAPTASAATSAPAAAAATESASTGEADAQ